MNQHLSSPLIFVQQMKIQEEVPNITKLTCFQSEPDKEPSYANVI